MATTDSAIGRVRSILVPTDGSDGAGRAIAQTMALADQLDADIHVLTVIDSSSSPLQFGISEAHELEQSKQRIIDDVLAEYDDHAVSITGAIRRGQPEEQIVEYAIEHEIDLIAISQTGASELERTLLGSTADRVVRAAPIPVLVVPGIDG